MIPVTDHIAIDEDEVVQRAARASGPGGQHVKTVFPFSHQ
jgi:protein subunit release factor B